MFKTKKVWRVFLSFLFLFSLVFFVASEHKNPDCCGCGNSLTIVNNTPSDIKLSLTSDQTEEISVDANSEMKFNFKKGVYSWVAYDVKTNKIISSGVVDLSETNGKAIISIKQ